MVFCWWANGGLRLYSGWDGVRRSDYYCKFGNFCDNLIFTKSVKGHICDVENLRLRHALPISVKDLFRHFVRILFCRNAKFCKNKTLAKISEFTVPLGSNDKKAEANYALTDDHT